MQPLRILLPCCLALGLLPVERSLAGEWRTGYGVSVNQLYTDNVCLDDSDQDEWVTTLTPRVSVSGKSRKAHLELAAAGELNTLSDNRCGSGRGDVDNFSPRLRADGGLEVLPDLFFIDASASIQQNALDPFRASGDSSINRAGNTNTTYNYAISPYLTQRVKDWADVTLRYEYDQQRNSEREASDSERHAASFIIASQPGGSPWFWSLTGNQQTVDYDNPPVGVAGGSGLDTREEDLAMVNFLTGYQINRKWQVYGSVGREFNDYEAQDDEIDGDMWRAGVRWTPSSRTSVDISNGERFFGESPRLTISHRHKHSQFRLSYEESLTYTRALRNEPVFFELQDAAGEPLLDEGGEPILIGFNLTTLTQSPVVDERLRLSWRWQRGRTEVFADASSSEQTRELDNYSSRFTSAGLGMSRRLSATLTLNGRLTFSETSVASGSESLGQDSETRRFYLNLQRELGQHTSLVFGYTLTDRESDNANDDYRENRISVGILMNW